jgi:hypothetical protein
MSDATGQAGLLNIMLAIIAIIIVLLSGSLAYSKSFRVKNRIIDIIEKHNSYDKDAREEVEQTLSKLGYRTASRSDYNTLCKDVDGFVKVNLTSNYLYCVYTTSDSSNDVYTYKVVAYMYFDIPFLSNTIKIPVSGMTKTLYKDNTKTVD